MTSNPVANCLETILNLPLEEASTRELLALFAGDTNFRSAMASELRDETEGFHRPLRPEDLTFLRLVPVEQDTASQLCALASQRALACINEAATTSRSCPPRAPQLAADHERFYGMRNAVLGELLRPRLEQVLFGRVMASLSNDRESAVTAQRFEELYRDRLSCERGLLGSRAADAAGREGLDRFSWLQAAAIERGLTQVYSVAASKGAPRGAAVFEALAELESRCASLDEGCAVRALSCRHHAHFQFYLATSLGIINHAQQLIGSQRRPLAAAGALLFHLLASRAYLDARLPALEAGEAASRLGARLLRLSNGMLEVMAEAGAQDAARELLSGVAEAARVRELSDQERIGQLQWLAAIDRYCEVGRAIVRLMESGDLEVDRETFVEPREMCSTTHVHDEHRLVVVESGQMVFWAEPGMTRRLGPGDVLFVPKGRLHGSTVESEQCVYHQPIIPDRLLVELLPRDLAFARREPRA